MARDKSVAEVLARQLDGLTDLIRNLLIDNPNLKSADWNKEPYYYREYPYTSSFVREVLREQAGHILQRVEAIRGIAVDMTEDIELSLPNQQKPVA